MIIKPFLCIFHSGASHTWFRQSSLPKGINGKATETKEDSQTLAGPLKGMLADNGIKHRFSSARNPQGNSIVERIHQAIGNVLRIQVAAENPKTRYEADRVIHKTLATAMHACRCAANGTLGNISSGAMAFHRDMFLDIPLIADILTLQKNRQALIDNRLLKANASRISHDYQVGEAVLKKSVLGLSDKLEPSFTGPYKIERVHTNGNVTIRLSPLHTERLNIRRIKPYKEQPT